jgi:hypothetical protein
MHYIVAYRAVAHKIHALNNRTTGLCNPFLSNGSVNTTRTIEEQCFRCDPHRGVILKKIKLTSSISYGDGVEYLHRSSASRRTRQKGKSRIWDNKIWSRVPRDSNPRMTALARTSSNCKRQTLRHVRGGAPHQQTRNCLTVIKNLVVSPRWVLYSKTDWPTDQFSWLKYLVGEWESSVVIWKSAYEHKTRR